MACVLIVEDDAALCGALEERLERMGYEVITAKNGKSGLHEALENKPDVILLDLEMPVMGGVKMLEHLRGDDWGAGVPVILLTNHEPDDDMTSSVVLYEPAYYLLKSNCGLAEVTEKIREVVAP